MCGPVAAAIIGSTLVSSAYQKQQSDKAESNARRRQKDAEQQATAERNAQDRNTAAAELNPLLITNKGKPGSQGMSQLKAKGGSGGYSALGLGGKSGTGLNISTGG